MLGKPIAAGRTAEVYAWEEGKILKLYFEWFPLRGVEYEAQMARAVCASGVPAPAAGEIVQVNGRSGLVYQRVDGETMSKTLQRRPWKLLAFARRMAEIHAQMHAQVAGEGIPSQRGRLVEKIQHAAALPEETRQRVLTALAALPDGNRLCHGDFHPENILMAEQGEVIIDWIDVTAGNPLADVARTSILMLGAAETTGVKNRLLSRFITLLHNTYLHRYFALRPGGEEEYERWLPVVAAGRISENISEQETWLIQQANLAG
ncbi:MAG TPA: aminoglycoside phosphotransferase family protein [Anaerolineaceae bacterium]